MTALDQLQSLSLDGSFREEVQSQIADPRVIRPCIMEFSNPRIKQVFCFVRKKHIQNRLFVKQGFFVFCVCFTVFVNHILRIADEKWLTLLIERLHLVSMMKTNHTRYRIQLWNMKFIRSTNIVLCIAHCKGL